MTKAFLMVRRAAMVVCTMGMASSCSMIIQGDLGKDPKSLVGKSRTEVQKQLGTPRASSASQDLFVVKGLWKNRSKESEYAEWDTWASFGLMEAVATPVSLVDKTTSAVKGDWLLVKYDPRSFAQSTIFVGPSAQQQVEAQRAKEAHSKRTGR